MQRKYERRLIYMASEKWMGWLCERCCWNRSLPESPNERAGVAAQVNPEFEAHSCEAFAHANWQPPPEPTKL
jgi:hypothetical protein